MKQIDSSNYIPLKRVFPKMKFRISSWHSCGWWFFLFSRKESLCEITVSTTSVMFVCLVSIYSWVLCDDSVFPFSLVTLETNIICMFVLLVAQSTLYAYQGHLNSFHISSWISWRICSMLGRFQSLLTILEDKLFVHMI